MMDTRQRSSGTSRVGALDHDLAARLAATEYDRVVELLDSLTPQQWSAPTDCPGWSVRDVAGHLLGMARMAASVRELVRQQMAAQRRAKRDGCVLLDGLTAHQVDTTAHLGPSEVVDAFRRIAPRAVTGRQRPPGFVRARTLPGLQDVGDHQESWTIGYLLDVILTRDPFMHRIDITRATGVPMRDDPAHEGVLVADLVAEWAGRHGAPYDLVLTGPAGGHWSRGQAEPIELDAFELCRVLSGRAPGTGLLAERVPF
jgi:uncharacterized protein (TIGR03083 family)